MKKVDIVERMAFARSSKSVQDDIARYSRIAACGMVLLTTGIFCQLYFDFMWVSAVGIGLLIAGFTRRDLYRAVAREQAMHKFRYY